MTTEQILWDLVHATCGQVVPGNASPGIAKAQQRLRAIGGK